MVTLGNTGEQDKLEELWTLGILNQQQALLTLWSLVSSMVNP